MLIRIKDKNEKIVKVGLQEDCTALLPCWGAGARIVMLLYFTILYYTIL